MTNQSGHQPSKYKAEQILEFHRIREMLCEQALSSQARERLEDLSPYLEEALCRRHLEETTGARRLLDAYGSPPLPTMNGMEELLTLCGAGAMLVPEQLCHVQQFAASCKRVRAYLKKAQFIDGGVATYGGSIQELGELQEEIERCIRGDVVDSAASPALRDIRRHMEKLHVQIKEKLNAVMNSKKKLLSDSYVSNRNGRYVLPVKKDCRNQFDGAVVEVSGSGGTYFMEPAVIARLQNSLTELEVEEDGEVRRILYTLTALAADAAPQIRLNMEAVETLDFIFAKAKLSAAMDAHPPQITTRREVNIVAGRHPLIPREQCVPLDFQVGGETAGVIITGPNTGGKTVALKAVGLLSMMAQCGLHIPASPESTIAMHAAYWCDIGDSQGIAENLSTFSGHMTNIIRILGSAGRHSLVLLDELGSGTDPAEGMGIAIAVLEELRALGCLFLVTTHYPQVKAYAEAAEDIRSARMAFNRETLRPLYRLELDKSGESCALHIAGRLGFPERLLNLAKEAAYAHLEQGASPAAFAPTPVKRLRRKRQGGQIQKQVERKGIPPHAAKFGLGDSVTVYPEKAAGLVFAPSDELGRIGVQVRGQKRWINHKRLQLKMAASQLYPEGYDLSIVLDTVENRKARRGLDTARDTSAEIHYTKEEWQAMQPLLEQMDEEGL